MKRINESIPSQITPWYYSKTLQYALLSALAGVITVLMTQHPDFGWLAIANAIVVAILRAITDKPLAY